MEACIVVIRRRMQRRGSWPGCGDGELHPLRIIPGEGPQPSLVLKAFAGGAAYLHHTMPIRHVPLKEERRLWGGCWLAGFPFEIQHVGCLELETQNMLSFLAEVVDRVV